MVNYTNKKLGLELKAQLDLGFNIIRLSRWAYSLFYDHRRELSLDIKEILIDLSRMEDDPQFEYTEQELRLLTEKLINDEKNPVKQINDMKLKEKS